MRHTGITAGLFASGVIGLIAALTPAARADELANPGISAEASAAVRT
jgi:hypothetical protein